MMKTTEPTKVVVYKPQTIKAKPVTVNLTGDSVFENKNYICIGNDHENSIIYSVDKLIQEFFTFMGEDKKFLVGFFVHQINYSVSDMSSIIFRREESYVFSSDGHRVYYTLNGNPNEYFMIILPEYQREFINRIFELAKDVVFNSEEMHRAIDEVIAKKKSCH